MNNDKIDKLGEGPSNKEKLLQPLREVGTINKTQYWTFDDAQIPWLGPFQVGLAVKRGEKEI